MHDDDNRGEFMLGKFIIVLVLVATVSGAYALYCLM